MTDFGKRFDAALRRRLFPTSALTVKQLAGAIGVSEDTVTRNWRGETRVSAESVAAIHEFFASRGDHAFAAEVYDIHQTPPNESLRGLVRDVLAEHRHAERHLWAMPEGIDETDVGHERYARCALGLHPLVEGDCRLYAMRNLAWVEITLGADRRAHIRYSASGITEQAAMTVLDWLLGRRDVIVSISRTVEIEREWVRAQGLSVDAIADELMLACKREGPRQRKSVRRSLDDVTSPRMAALLRGWNDSPTVALDVAGALGVTRRLSIYAVEGEDVTCRWIGPGLEIPRKLVGTNVIAWPDPEYGADVRRRMILADREGQPTFTSLELPMFGRWLTYDALSFPIGRGEVVSMTERRAVA